MQEPGKIHKLVDWNERLQYLELLTSYLAYLWVKIVTIPHLQSRGYHISSKLPESAHHKKKIMNLTKFCCRDRKHNLTKLAQAGLHLPDFCLASWKEATCFLDQCFDMMLHWVAWRDLETKESCDNNIWEDEKPFPSKLQVGAGRHQHPLEAPQWKLQSGKTIINSLITRFAY